MKPSNESEATPTPEPGLLRWWVAFPIALPIILIDAFWVIYAEKVGWGPYFTTISLFANVFFILTVLLLLNVALRRFSPKLMLSQAELLTIYSMVGVGAALAGHDCVPSLIQQMGHPYQYDNSANGWLDRFGRFLPQQMLVPDKEILKGYYFGNSSFYRPENFNAWLRPSLLWIVFISLLFAAMQCLNVLMRQGWQERERLPFPVIEIPIQMTEPDARLWKSSLFWIGFGVCTAIEILNGIAWLVPGMPSIDLKHHDVSGEGIFTTRPFNAVGFTCYSFYPFAIGLGYLLPLDLLFSCWFFYLFWKAQMIVSAMLALDVTPDFPFVREQSFGGYIAILIFMFWNGRHYFAQVWERIWGLPADLDDRQEALTYRAAFLGFLFCLAALCGFLIWMGMSPLLAFTAFFIYFCLSVAVTRLRAELGPPVHDLHFTGPDHILTRSFGTPAFKPNDLTILTFFYWFNRAYRSHPEPVAIEGLKAARQINASQKTMFWGMMLAAVVGTIAVFWAYLHMAYQFGTQAKWNQGSGFAWEAYNRLNGWLQTPQPPNAIANGAMGVGFLFCSLLMIARIKFPWWPFHPIGYAISSSWSINLVWLPLLIAWVLKGLILRYGGVRLYRQAMPFFIGILLGQMIVGTLWHLICIYLETMPYSFWGG